MVMGRRVPLLGVEFWCGWWLVVESAVEESMLVPEVTIGRLLSVHS